MQNLFWLHGPEISLLFFTFYHFWNQYTTTQFSYLSTHAPLPLKSKIKHTAPLVKAEKQTRVEISIHRGKVLHLQRKTKQKFRLRLSYHIYTTVFPNSASVNAVNAQKVKLKIFIKDHRFTKMMIYTADIVQQELEMTFTYNPIPLHRYNKKYKKKISHIWKKEKHI